MASFISYRTMKFFFMLLFALCHACASYCSGGCDTTDADCGASDVIREYWHGMLGESEDPPPITWVTRGDCQPNSGSVSFTVGGVCASGVFLSPNAVVVSYTDGSSRNTLAHELTHASLYRRGRSDWADHFSPEFLHFLPAYQRADWPETSCP